MVRDDCEPFLERARSAGAPVVRFVKPEIRAYLTCGILAHGRHDAGERSLRPLLLDHRASPLARLSESQGEWDLPGRVCFSECLLWAVRERQLEIPIRGHLFEEAALNSTQKPALKGHNRDASILVQSETG